MTRPLSLGDAMGGVRSLELSTLVFSLISYYLLLCFKTILLVAHDLRIEILNCQVDIVIILNYISSSLVGFHK